MAAAPGTDQTRRTLPPAVTAEPEPDLKRCFIVHLRTRPLSPNLIDDSMIPATRRAATSCLIISCKAQGRQFALGAGTSVGCHHISAQLDGGTHQQTRGFSQTTSNLSALNHVPLRKEKGDVKSDGKSEDPLGRPEHAVISTFDLFSIGGPYSNLSFSFIEFSRRDAVVFQLAQVVRTPSALCGPPGYLSTI